VAKRRALGRGLTGFAQSFLPAWQSMRYMDLAKKREERAEMRDIRNEIDRIATMGREGYQPSEWYEQMAAAIATDEMPKEAVMERLRPGIRTDQERVSEAWRRAGDNAQWSGPAQVERLFGQVNLDPARARTLPSESLFGVAELPSATDRAQQAVRAGDLRDTLADLRASGGVDELLEGLSLKGTPAGGTWRAPTEEMPGLAGPLGEQWDALRTSADAAMRAREAHQIELAGQLLRQEEEIRSGPINRMIASWLGEGTPTDDVVGRLVTEHGLPEDEAQRRVASIMAVEGDEEAPGPPVTDDVVEKWENISYATDPPDEIVSLLQTAADPTGTFVVHLPGEPILEATGAGVPSGTTIPLAEWYVMRQGEFEEDLETLVGEQAEIDARLSEIEKAGGPTFAKDEARRPLLERKVALAGQIEPLQAALADIEKKIPVGLPDIENIQVKPDLTAPGAPWVTYPGPDTRRTIIPGERGRQLQGRLIPEIENIQVEPDLTKLIPEIELGPDLTEPPLARVRPKIPSIPDIEIRPDLRSLIPDIKIKPDLLAPIPGIQVKPDLKELPSGLPPELQDRRGGSLPSGLIRPVRPTFEGRVFTLPDFTGSIPSVPSMTKEPPPNYDGLTSSLHPYLTDDQIGKVDYARESLMEAGYSDTQARAIIRELIAESELKETATGDRGTAHGIAQWRRDRRDDMEAYVAQARKRDRNLSEFQAQVKFLIEELEISGGGPKEVPSSFGGMNTWFIKEFLRPSNKNAEARINRTAEYLEGSGDGQ
jgi:hypothetical protein